MTNPFSCVLLANSQGETKERRCVFYLASSPTTHRLGSGSIVYCPVHLHTFPFTDPTKATSTQEKVKQTPFILKGFFSYLPLTGHNQSIPMASSLLCELLESLHLIPDLFLTVEAIIAILMNSA